MIQTTNSAKTTTKSVLGNHSPNQKHNKNNSNKKNLFDFCGLRVMALNLKRNKCHLNMLPDCPMNSLYSRNISFRTLGSAYKASTPAS